MGCISGTASIAATRAISVVPGLAKQTSRPAPAAVRTSASAPFMRESFGDASWGGRFNPTGIPGSRTTGEEYHGRAAGAGGRRARISEVSRRGENVVSSVPEKAMSGSERVKGGEPFRTLLGGATGEPFKCFTQ